jgi:ABC-type transport system involved in cytochrome bd biosynthesis fused ATPase/permease subunit
LAPGRRIAVIGPSGCGKTTLAYLLVRFLDPIGGRVTLNGVDLRDLAGDDVRRVVALMDESVHCFDTTIEGNLRVARREATEEQLWEALSRARLDQWVRGLPLGLSTPVGEHGSHLSGGQRRRLALARVLLTGAPILVLDEPTEHLDDETAAALTADLLAATVGRGLVLITHRPFGLSNVDEVVDLTSAR